MLQHSWFLAFSLAVLTPQFAAAQTASNTIDLATAALDAGDYQTAAAHLEAEQRARPGDPLTLRLLGTVYAYSREYAKAIVVLQQARSIAPADQDIALMLARSYLWSGRHYEADATAQDIANADPENTELPQLRKAIEEAEAEAAKTKNATLRPWTTVNVTQTLSDVVVGNQSNNWYQTIVGLSAPIAAVAVLSGAIDRESRSGPVDTRFDLRADMNVGDARYAYVSVSATPNADFREKWGVRAGGEVGVNKTFIVTADLRYADYGLSQIVALEPGIRLHSADDHLSLAIKSINLWSNGEGLRSGWSVRGEAQAKKSVRIATGGATYPDTEAGITRRTRAAFFGAIIDLSDRMTVRILYEYERRVQSYTRNGIVLALSVRF